MNLSYIPFLVSSLFVMLVHLLSNFYSFSSSGKTFYQVEVNSCWSNSCRRCSFGLRSRLWRPVKLYHTQTCSFTSLVYRLLIRQEGAISKMSPLGLERCQFKKNLLVCWSIISSFQWKQKIGSNFWKTDPHHNPISIQFNTQDCLSRQVPFDWLLDTHDSSL